MHKPHGFGSGGGHHHRPAAHSHSAMQLSMRASKMAQAAGLKALRQAAARSRAGQAQVAFMYRAKARREALAEQAAQRRVQAQRNAMLMLGRALAAAVQSPMDCQPLSYGKFGAAMFFQHNWISRDGTPQVVFACNTVLPGSGKPAAALCWGRAGITPVDLQREGLAQAAKRGRLFVFPANINLVTGESYAVRPATHVNSENGPPGLWSFATAGLFRNQAFLIGHAALGTFENPELGRMLVARPVHWSQEKSLWSWAGRSSAEHGGKRALLVEAFFNPDPDARVDFRLASITPGSDIVTVPCRATDAHGDPVGVVDTTERVPYRIQRIGERLHFVARPNQRDSKGRLFFAGRAAASQTGQLRFEVPFAENGEEITAALPSNYRDARGTPWFVRYANARERHTGVPLVLVPLGRS